MGACCLRCTSVRLAVKESMANQEYKPLYPAFHELQGMVEYMFGGCVLS